jgi:hypothetical protein
MKTYADFGIYVNCSGSGNVKVPCPQCLHERKNKNDKSLSVNLDKGVWKCHHCGWTGFLKNTHNKQSIMKPSHQNNHKTPNLQYVVPMPEEILKYLTHDRKIPEDTIKRNKIRFSGKAIQFPFFMNGELVNVKHRTMDKKFWQEAGSKKTVYGYDDIQNNYLIWTEGEFDKLSFEVAGELSCVSVPDGAPSSDAKNLSVKFDFLNDLKTRLDEVQVHIIAVDNDSPGKALAFELAHRLGPDKCKIVDWPEDCKDANEVLLKHGVEILKDCISSARDWNSQNAPKSLTFDAPLPLRRVLSQAKAFPIDALGDVLGGAAQAMHDVIQAPLAMCGNSILAANALAVQGHVDVVIDGRVSPTSEFFVSIGESGERKSAVDKLALAPHRERQNKLREQFERDHKCYLLEAEAFKKTKEETLKKEKGLSNKKDALGNLGDEPEKPLHPNLIMEEPTYEGLVKLLEVGQPSQGLFSDEGGRFIGGHGMNSDNALKTAAGLCGLWDGTAISRVRSGDGAILLVGRRVSFHLMCQPKISQMFLSNSLLLEQGLISRCLCSYPGSAVGTRKYRATNLKDTPELQGYFNRIQEVLSAPFNVGMAKNELVPEQITLDQQAKQLWVAFHDQIESQLSQSGSLSSIRGFGNKAPEHAARIAANLAWVNDPEIRRIRKIRIEYMQNSISIIQYYLSEALRLFNAGDINHDLILAGELHEWFLSKDKTEVSLVEIYKSGPNAIREAKMARKIMRILEEHRYAVPLEEGIEYEGVLRKEAWRIQN